VAGSDLLNGPGTDSGSASKTRYLAFNRGPCFLANPLPREAQPLPRLTSSTPLFLQSNSRRFPEKVIIYQPPAYGQKLPDPAASPDPPSASGFAERDGGFSSATNNFAKPA
jgi:hypothetical protein